MFKKIMSRAALVLATLSLITTEAMASPLGNMVDRSCVATEQVKQETRIAALPPSAIPGYSQASAALHKRKAEIFDASEHTEKLRTDAAWNTAREVLQDRPSLLDRLKKAVLYDYPQLQRGGSSSRQEFERLLIEYARVDPELLSEINRRLQNDTQYDALLTNTLKIGDRIDELEGEQISLNEAIPPPWDEQEKATLRAAREFAVKSSLGGQRMESTLENPALRQALSIAAALDAQTKGALPEDYRPVQAEGTVIEGRVVGLPMPETRSFIRAIDSIIRRGELRLTHVDADKLGNADERAAMQTNPARQKTRAVAQKIMGKGLNEILVGDVLSREMSKATVPPPLDLTTLPPAEREQKVQQFLKSMEKKLEPKAIELQIEYILE